MIKNGGGESDVQIYLLLIYYRFVVKRKEGFKGSYSCESAEILNK